MKRRRRRIGKYALPILIAVAIPILLARCTPQWLPDSKRFVYLGDGAVRLYDIEKQEGRRIAGLKFPAADLAIWPTGDRIAVVQFPDHEEFTLQINVYDLEGNELHASPIYEPKKLSEGDVKRLMFLNTSVSPDGKHLVTFPAADSGAVSYDVEREQFREHPGIVPVDFLAGMMAADGKRDSTIPLGYDVSAATPDGKGFLAVKIGQGEEGGFYLHPWGDKEPVPLKLADQQREALKSAAKKLREQNVGVGTIPRWQDDALVMYVHGEKLSIDLVEKSCSLEKGMHSDALLQHAKRHKVTVIGELAGGALLQVKERKLQLWRRGGATTDLLQRHKEGGFLAISVSPDERKVLVRSLGDGKDVLEVFDVTGQRLAELKHASAFR